MAVGYLIGGQAGMLIALLVAAATNIFTYWNSDKMVLSMNGAHEVDERPRHDSSSVAAVVLTHDAPEALERCLTALGAQTLEKLPVCDWQIVVLIVPDNFHQEFDQPW